MSEFKFDPYTEFLNCGNRVDREIMGTGEDDDWYSYEAGLEFSSDDDGQAFVTVYGDGIDSEYWQVTWEKVDPQDVHPDYQR